MHADSIACSVIWASMRRLNGWRRAEYLIHFVDDPCGAPVITLCAKSTGDARLAEDAQPRRATELLQIGTLQTPTDQALSWLLAVLEEAAALVTDGSVALHDEVAQVRTQHGRLSVCSSRMGFPKRTQHYDLNNLLCSVGFRSCLPAEDDIHESPISNPVVGLIKVLEMMYFRLVESVICDFDPVIRRRTTTSIDNNQRSSKQAGYLKIR